ncbi:hypothetical protein GZH47_25415 [Paenibacillus rhizovicinus]|uniref:Uncharacterized protein n=1 Tax=Paenibacillus rhizovicinus TaxID=2704463 RepID=A0A6C0P5M7_9BACL|nr:hypothetical protein [Paenibacillus rhizovicinus]QHW33807.1 hypothetical protein GZH47_25415 [Paenibacillus rhizovicinus]
MANKRRWSIAAAGVLVIVLFASIYYYVERGNNSYTSITMFMNVEKKEYDIEPGRYLKMWVTGSNSSDSSQSKLKYKVMIKDSMVYNLLEEGKEYFVSLEGIKKKNQSEYTYTFNQVGHPGGTQLSGEGKME